MRRSPASDGSGAEQSPTPIWDKYPANRGWGVTLPIPTFPTVEGKSAVNAGLVHSMRTQVVASLRCLAKWRDGPPNSKAIPICMYSL